MAVNPDGLSRSSKARKQISIEIKREIKALALMGYDQTQIGAKYGVSQPLVSRIKLDPNIQPADDKKAVAELMRAWR